MKDQMMDVIRKHGWAVLGTEFEPPHSRRIQAGMAPGQMLPVAYTVGLMHKGLPEFMIFGLPMVHAQQILNDAAVKAMDPEFEQQSKWRAAKSPQNAPDWGLLQGGYQVVAGDVTSAFVGAQQVSDLMNYDRLVDAQNYCEYDGFAPWQAIHFAEACGLSMPQLQFYNLFFQDAQFRFPWDADCSFKALPAFGFQSAR